MLDPLPEPDLPRMQAYSDDDVGIVLETIDSLQQLDFLNADQRRQLDGIRAMVGERRGRVSDPTRL